MHRPPPRPRRLLDLECEVARHVGRKIWLLKLKQWRDVQAIVGLIDADKARESIVQAEDPPALAPPTDRASDLERDSLSARLTCKAHHDSVKRASGAGWRALSEASALGGAAGEGAQKTSSWVGWVRYASRRRSYSRVVSAEA
jgi:hypothetical protein